MVLNIESALNEMGSIESILAGKDEIENVSEKSLPDFCLIPVTSTSTTLALQSDRLIIAVHSSLPGVRAAYNQLAFLASLKTDFNVCVIMIGARTIKDAKRYFNFLCDSSESFLELKLECGGFLLEDSEGIVPTEEDDPQIATNLQDVVQGILEDLKPGRKDEGAGNKSMPSLGPSSGPPLYLS